MAEPRAKPTGRVLIVHDAYGLLPHVRFLCDDLAEHGFVALAPDLYQGSTAGSDAEAERLMQQLSATHAERVLTASLWGFEYVGHGKGPLAAVGFSIGAEFAYGLAARHEVDAVVAYYGVPRAEDRVRIDAPVLMHWAEIDEWEAGDEPDLIITVLERLGARVEHHAYEGTRHSFANAELDAFDLDAAERAWQRTLEFLARVLSGQ